MIAIREGVVMQLELTLAEKLERVKDFRPIDDVFFEVLASNPRVCEEMLRTILEDSKLVVLEVITQASERNIYGRSVRLDALCTLGSGKKVNIEVQRADNDDHFRRARFNASSITVKNSNPGDRFEDVLDLYIVYISEHDFIREGKTTYHIDKVIRETGTVIEDGLEEVFVNTEVYDGTDIAELMKCFKQKTVDDPRFPVLTKEIRHLKETEGGASAVCEVMQKYMAEERAAGRAEKEAEMAKALRKNGVPEEIIQAAVRQSREQEGHSQ